MNKFREPLNPPGSDPLERLVEAFVELSVPEGPDAATQRRLIAALNDNSSPAPRSITLRPAEEPTSRVRRWSRTALQQTLGLAVAMAAVVMAALYLTPSQSDAPADKGGSQIASSQPDAGPADNDAIDTPAEREDYVRILLERYLARNDGKLPTREAFNDFVTKVLEDNPELARSKSWQVAQQRLTSALEQPEVIGLGVGLLGTLPWTTYGRF
jgi:hypothetical protein